MTRKMIVGPRLMGDHKVGWGMTYVIFFYLKASSCGHECNKVSIIKQNIKIHLWCISNVESCGMKKYSDMRDSSFKMMR